MKKILIAATAFAAVLFSSCGSGQAGNAEDTLVSVGQSDSISIYYGLMAGSFINSQLDYYAREEGVDYNRREFIKGMQVVLSNKHPEEFIAGISYALQMSQGIRNMEAQGVQINREKLLNALRSAILADSITDIERETYQQVYQSMMSSVQMKAQARTDARRAQSTEAVENAAAAEAYLKNILASKPEAKQSESGLVYIVETEGEGTKVQNGDNVRLKYVGSLADGTVFDNSDDAVFTAGDGVIPGFAEGLRLLGKGGKARLFIPGNLAYGVNGIPSAGIGPNQMLIFDIEILDVNTAENAK